MSMLRCTHHGIEAAKATADARPVGRVLLMYGGAATGSELMVEPLDLSREKLYGQTYRFGCPLLRYAGDATNRQS